VLADGDAGEVGHLAGHGDVMLSEEVGASALHKLTAVQPWGWAV
jgi:hypothetical protein